jgi:hypothetical protein
VARFPLLYSIDEVARRYGVFPATIDLHNPEHLVWVRRAWIFLAMESDRDKALEKRENRRRR